MRRRAVQVRGVGVALALVALADLQHELAVLRELQELVVGDRLKPGRPLRRAVVAADPDEALVVDMDAVLALRPLVARAGAAPGLDEIARRVEHHDRRRRHRGLLRLERARPVQHPDVVLRIDGDAGRIAELPLRRHLRPAGVDLEGGSARVCAPTSATKSIEPRTLAARTAQIKPGRMNSSPSYDGCSDAYSRNDPAGS